MNNKRSWNANIITLFPDMFPGPLGVSIIGNALKSNIWSLTTTNLRDFGEGKHNNIDDTPAGGGPGMVMRADILASAIDAVSHKNPDLPIIYLSPKGTPFTQKKAHEFTKKSGVILLCGRFEGIDQRVIEKRNIQEISIGDFILTGGEIAAMAMLDAIIRLLPGVIGDHSSLSEESFEQGLLEYPHYTRPQIWEDAKIPEILKSGDHGRIAEWRLEHAKRLTMERRPDLWQKFIIDQKDYE